MFPRPCQRSVQELTGKIIVEDKEISSTFLILPRSGGSCYMQNYTITKWAGPIKEDLLNPEKDEDQ